MWFLFLFIRLFRRRKTWSELSTSRLSICVVSSRRHESSSLGYTQLGSFNIDFHDFDRKSSVYGSTFPSKITIFFYDFIASLLLSESHSRLVSGRDYLTSQSFIARDNLMISLHSHSVQSTDFFRGFSRHSE